MLLLFLLISGMGMVCQEAQAANAQIVVKTTPSGYGTVKAGNSSYQATVQVAAAVGSKLTLYAKPNTGYKFVKWEDNSTAATRTVTVPNAKTTTYTATFAVATYTLTVTSNNTNYGTATGGGTYNYNTSVTLTATPKTGYHFVQWSDGNKNASRTVTATANASYTATFAINTYTITVTSNNTNYGTVTGGGTYNHGAKATLTATPKTGYHFVKWSDNNTNASRSITVTAAATYTATFAINTYTITATSANTSMGTVTGGGTYNHGSSAKLTATSKGCYRFKQWSDGNTTNPRTVTVTAAKTYTASFEQTTHSGTCGTTGSNVTWVFNECTGVLSISGTGAMKRWEFSVENYPPWYDYRSSIKSVVIANGVTNIGGAAFQSLTNLTSVTIPNSVTVIQDAAFYGCSSLTSITLPSGLTSIGNGQCCYFAYSGLQSITIPSSVTSIGQWSFCDINSLTDIYVSWTGTIPTWTNMTNKSGITLHVPCGTTQLYKAASGWKNYTILGNTQYTITATSPSSTQGTVSIDGGTAGTSVNKTTYCDNTVTITAAPKDCYRFTQWSDGVTSNPRTVTVSANTIYTAQFSNTYSGNCGATGNEANVQWSLNMCTGALSITGTGNMKDYSGTDTPWYPYRGFITSVTISNSVTSIGNCAFYYCSNMKSVSMGTGVTSIGDYAFYECNNLTSITIGNHVTNIGNNAFNNCSNLTTVTIPPSVTSIANYAFSGCYAMESLYITDLAAWCNISFGGSAASPFYRNVYSNHLGGGNLYVNGTKVTTLTIPDGITAIPAYAFYGFAGITDIQFNQTKTIGSYAFCGCHGLTHVTITEGVTAISNNSFAYCTHLQSMSIPASAMSIGTEMMYNCQAQTDIYVHWTENVPVWPSTFTSKSPQSSITLHVPTCKQSLYTGGWANYTLDAETEERTVSIASNNATYGLVQYNDETPVASIEKQLSCITTFTVTAVPAEGYHFVEWSDGLLQGIRQLGNLESDTALTALFGPGVPPEIYDDQAGSLQQGVLSGAFSVSATQVVYFSQGPLQFNASLGTHECADGTTKPGTWRFAEHQYDVVGDLNAGNVYENGVKCSNTLASATYTGWQDMYCWGASGYNGIEPYKANRPSTTSIAGTNYDWGVYNAISNGGNTPGLWRTPTRTEWDYMFNMRPNAKQLNAPAMVEGMYGLVVLPDDYWDAPAGINLVTTSTQYYTDNVFTAAQWQQLEAAGAVFIPSGGWFSWSSNTWVSHFANTGELWASTGSSTSSQHDVQWGNDRQAYLSASSTHVLEQLRLVSDVGGYTKVRFVGIDSHGDKFVIAYIYVPYGATPVPPEVPERECYTFTGWDRTISPANGRMTTYTAQYEDLIYSGTCGADGDNLTWTLNACDSTLIISGTGAMANYPAMNMPWKDYRTSITSVIISGGVTTIGAYAFNGCSHLTSLTVPLSLTSVGQYAFTSCWAMESVYISDLEAWCNIDFGTYDSSPFSRNGYLNYVGGGDLYVNGTKVTTLTIPDGITEIKHHAFYGFAGITSIDFNQVTSIGNEAFNGCHGLSEITIPEGVTAIGNFVFAYCTHLQSISIPASASSLGTSMLAANNMLTDIHVQWTENIPAWPDNFTKKNPQSSITLHIPCAAIELYQDADGWKDYTIEAEGGPYTVTVQAEDPTMGDVSITVN